MEDPEPLGPEDPAAAAAAAAAGNNNPHDEHPEELTAEEAMERMLQAQEEAEENEGPFDENRGEHGGAMDGDDDNFGPDNDPDNDDHNIHANMNFMNINAPPKERPITYVQASFLAAFCLVYYAFRSRQQWYLALVFLSSSKWAYIVLGNALVAFFRSKMQGCLAILQRVSACCCHVPTAARLTLSLQLTSAPASISIFTMVSEPSCVAMKSDVRLSCSNHELAAVICCSHPHLVFAVDIGALVNQRLDSALMAFFHGKMQGCLAIL